MIGVCIKYFHENYGGMLQAFATIKMLEKRKMQYELIRYEKKYTIWQKIKFSPRLLNGVLMRDKYEGVKKKIGVLLHKEFAQNDAIRMKAFHDFRDTYFVNLADVSVGYDSLCRKAKEYDAVITGSDQLWSPAGLPTNFYNLMFVPEEIRKISYASSFGVSEIPWYQKRRTREFLKRIEYISMRENRGAEIVKNLTNREVNVILDPVFMLDQNEWNIAIPSKRLYEEKYVFAYFLGENAIYRRKVNEFAKKNNFKIVTLRHLDQYVKGDETFGDFAPYNVGPAEFLNLIRGAEYVFTDSFHGTCFSVINKKQFLVFDRYNNKSKVSKNSRIDSLCENLHLSSRRFSGDVSDVQKEIDYADVQKELDEMLKKTNDYLDEAFNDLI